MKEQQQLGKFRDPSALILSILICFGTLALVIKKAMTGTGGLFIYPVDDAYIHMEIAKNIALHGNWGINASEFGSASSSPLYTIILSIFFILFSPNIYIPFIVNCLAGLLLLYVIWRWLTKHGINRLQQIVILLLVVFLTPLPLLMFCGMEHTLQCLFSFLFLFGFADWLQANNEKQTKLPWTIFLYAIFTATIRYEGLFLVGMAGLALLYQRRIGTAITLGAVAALPLVIFGAYSVAQGSYFLPNSVLVKSEAAQFTAGGMAHAVGHIIAERLVFSKSGIALLAVQRLLFILPIAYFTLTRPVQVAYRFILLALTGTALLQLTLADTGKFYRYEGYLIVAATVLLCVLVLKHWKERLSAPHRGLQWLVYFIVFFLFLPIIFRSLTANNKLAQASVNIYDQQYQMTLFIQKFYDNGVVAANDIGAISYFTNARIVDLWGLGDIDIARSKKGGYWTPAFLDSFCRKQNTDIAIIYDSWIDQSIPPQWKKTAEWKIQNNVVCGDDYVSFYAVDTTHTSELRKNLETFSESLPKTVTVTYFE